MFEISNEENETMNGNAKIKVVGVGGGGCNAVNTMIRVRCPCEDNPSGVGK